MKTIIKRSSSKKFILCITFIMMVGCIMCMKNTKSAHAACIKDYSYLVNADGQVDESLSLSASKKLGDNFPEYYALTYSGGGETLSNVNIGVYAKYKIIDDDTVCIESIIIQDDYDYANMPKFIKNIYIGSNIVIQNKVYKIKLSLTDISLYAVAKRFYINGSTVFDSNITLYYYGNYIDTNKLDGINVLNAPYVTNISKNAFKDSGKLRRVNICSKLNVYSNVNIDDYAFSNCTNLKEFIYPKDEYVKIMLGANSFENTAIDTIELDRNIKLNGMVFTGCSTKLVYNYLNTELRDTIKNLYETNRYNKLTYDPYIKVTEMSLSIQNMQFTGKALIPKKVETTSLTLTPDIIFDGNYTITCKNNINAGIATATITGTNNANDKVRFIGTRDVTFIIDPLDIKKVNCQLSSNKIVYNGVKKSPAISLSYDGIEIDSSNITTKYRDNLEYGTANVQITGQKNLTGITVKTFDINRLNFEEDKINIELSINKFTYDCRIHTPSIEVTYDNEIINSDNYNIVYPQDSNIGKKNIAITGIKNCTGTIYVPYEIKTCNINNNDFKIEVDQCIYNGKEQEPNLRFYYLSHLLNKEDYDLLYYDNVDAGQGTVKITGKNNLSGTEEFHFEIAKKNVSDSDTTFKLMNGTEEYPKNTIDSIYECTYTEMAINPYVEMYCNGIKINQLAFMIKIDDAIQVTKCGEYECVMTGIGNYTGVTSLKYRVIPQDINNLYSFIESSQYAYNGQEIKPTVFIKINGKPANPENYKITYHNNINISKDDYLWKGGEIGDVAFVTIKGVNNLIGEKTLPFIIYDEGVMPTPAPTNPPKSTEAPSNTNTPSTETPKPIATGLPPTSNPDQPECTRIPESTQTPNIQVPTATPSVVTHIPQISTSTAVPATLVNNQSVKVIELKLKKCKIVRCELKKNNVYIKINKVEKASGYCIYRASSKKGKYKLIARTNKNEDILCDKTVKKKGQYYYKIAAYGYQGHDKVFGRKSELKSIYVSDVIFIKPIIKGKRMSSIGNMSYLQIKWKPISDSKIIKKGKFQIEYNNGNGIFKSFKIDNNNLKHYNNQIKILTDIGNGKCKIRFRIANKEKGKKYYSKYSNVIILK